ncbi:MAG: Large cysteine-rich periplasmic protein OmcB precursor [Planctomycetes bacterium ADurb.Bin126]|nr:MAG: Large cysteine-rich periplasmic protein OmcB precursor [Planctomycetes bacterium ADurb.Bin126]HOD82283.1 hypothetical protein [Phycisphaerae bacterium]HQL72904.1 hypothetical protein [Phycisphaerae bacterium]
MNKKLSVLATALAIILVGCADTSANNGSSIAATNDKPTFTESPPAGPPASPSAAATPPAGPGPAAPAARRDADGMETISVMLPGGPNGTVLLEKSAPAEVQVGKEFIYRLRLTNQSQATLEGTVLTGKLPTDFNVTASSPEASITGRDAVWQVGKMAPGDSKVFVVRGSATKTGTIVACSDVTFRVGTACLPIRVVEPALKLVQTAPPEVLLCDAIPVRVVVTNTGSGRATNVMVTETLPAGLQTADGKKTLEFNAGDLAAGQSREFTFECRATKAGEFSKSAAAAGDDGLKAAAGSKTIVRQPVLAMTADAPRLRYVGLDVQQTFTVTNKGDGTARNTTLALTLPSNAALKAATEGNKPEPGKVSWNLGNLAPNESKKVVTVMKADAIGDVECFAAATADCAKTSAKTVTQVKGIPAILLECVDLVDPVAIGEKTTYEITVLNQGSAEGTNIVVKCTLPAEEEFVSATGPTKETVEGQTVTFAPLKSLAPKDKTVYRLVIKGLKEGDVRFKISLISDQMTSPAEETESTHIFSDK